MINNQKNDETIAFKKFFLMWAIFKAFIELLTILFLFYALDFLAMRRVGILAPWPGIEPASPALEDEVLTTEQPGKCHNNCLLKIPDESRNAVFRDILSKEQLWEEKWVGRTRGRYKKNNCHGDRGLFGSWSRDTYLNTAI